MVVKFDSLNRFERPLFHLCNPGAKYENGALTRSIGILPETSDEEIQFEFNTTSTLSLRAYKRTYEDPEQDEFFRNLFDGIQNRRLIYVDNIGFFMITNVVDGYEDEVVFKDIEADSCEAELMDKELPYIEDGTYSIDEMIEKIGSKIPMWKFTHIDESIKAKYRTFEDVDTDQNVLDFLLEDMQTAYECIFIFDPTYRAIDVYDQKTYVHETGIQLTRSDLIQASEQESNVEDFYTALSVYGDGDITIAAVNPLGTTTMYNFNYYLDWMPPELSKKVSEWQKLVWYYADQNGTTPPEDNYPDLGKQYCQKYTEFLDLRADCERLETIIDYYQRALDNVAASGSTFIESYNKYIRDLEGKLMPENDVLGEDLQNVIKGLISETQVELATQQAKRDATEKEAQGILDHMGEINKKVDMKTYFTQEEYEELSCYIAEGEYTDEYIIVTDEMTYTEQYDQYATLYGRATDQLMKISQPTEEYSIDVENFLFQKSFQHMSEELETGCIINVELDNGDIAPLFLTGITVNYDDMQLELTLGNRFMRIDPQRMFKDVLGDVKRSANSLSYMQDVLDPLKKGELDRLSEELANSRNLTKDKALGARNQQVLIDDSGYTGRLLDPESGEIDPHQIKIINNVIVFTDDYWDTCKTALGEITFLDEAGRQYTRYGLNAEVVLGDLLLGSELHIQYQMADQDEKKDLVESLTQFDVDMYGLHGRVSMKTNSFYGDTPPTPPYHEGDIWFKSGKEKTGEILTCIKDKLNEGDVYEERDWEERNQYTQNLETFKATDFKMTQDFISLMAELKDGEGNYKSELKLTPKMIELVAEEINITGYVTFSELKDGKDGTGLDIKGNNVTEINGSHITTGTIDADLIRTGILANKDWGTGKGEKNIFYLDLDNGILKMKATDLTITNSSFTILDADGNAKTLTDMTEGYFNSLDHKALFNQLTENGKIKGLFMGNTHLDTNLPQNDYFYVNADYIQSGTLKLGGANNVNGLLEIYNESGIRIGYWNNTGIWANNASFDGNVSVKGKLTASAGSSIGGGYVNGTLNAGRDDLDITNISASNITTGTLGADVIYAGKIEANQIKAGTLNSNVIYAGKIETNQIKAGTLNSDVIYGGTIYTGQIKDNGVGITITSGSITIKSSGKFVLDSTNCNISENGTITATLANLVQARFQCPGGLGNPGGMDFDNGTAVLSGGHIRLASNGAYSFGISGRTPHDGSLWLARTYNAYAYFSAQNQQTWIAGNSIIVDRTPTSSSDRDLKTAITPLNTDYSAILDELIPVTFRYKRDDDDAPLHYGYIAQDVETALNNLGIDRQHAAFLYGENGSGNMGIAYSEIIPLLHLKIKQLEERIKVLENTTE